VRETALEAYAHQDLPFEKLVEELQPRRELSYTPLFQVMFALQNVPRQALNFSGLSVSSLAADTGAAKFDLALTVLEEQDGLQASWEFNADLFLASTITRMACHFQNLLEGIVANPEQRLSGLPMLTKAEKQQLLVEWNDTERNYPADRCIHELFEAQVERTPKAVAVVFADKQG
jgi:non-ribosomal peptide synthetase component F